MSHNGDKMDQATANKPAGPLRSDDRTPNQARFTPLWNNFVTMGGIFLVIIAVLGLLTFALFNMVMPGANPYVDIVGYLAIPSVLIVGLVIMPVGIFLKSWWRHRTHPEEHLVFRFPQFDLNDPAQRRAAKIVVGGTFVLLPVVGVSSYHGYHYTDSADFCSKACHAVMEPQATAYEHSAHARVPCAECHIGAGASWFVKSKLSGTRQVIATWRDSYPRPIPPAITELRPARETCEECHWPQKFFGAQLAEIVRFGFDEQNTRRDINMLLKTGGGDPTTGRTEGIHKHMALEAQIEYIATDDRLQEIPWVKWTKPGAEPRIYRSDERPSSDPQPEGLVRTLDCMDCHNRPAHKFRAPTDAVDLFLETEQIDVTLPFIKREAVKALAEPYPDVVTANAQIGATLSDFYRDTYPELWDTQRVAVNNAIDQVRLIYERNFFPAMKVDWRTYPDNIGHKFSPGCFRCHEGRHVNQFGEVISHECQVCHEFLNPIDAGGTKALAPQGRFTHSVELAGPHAALRCDRCHTGGDVLDPTCDGCHATQTAFRTGTLAAFAEFALEPDPMADVACQDCHDLSQPTSIEAIGPKCADCHDEEYAELAGTWKQEVTRLLEEARRGADDQGQVLIDLLERAGPLHNVEATRRILERLTTEPSPAPASAVTTAD